MDKKLYKFGMDWLNGVLPVVDVWEVFETLEKFSSKLRFDRWELVNAGKYNYSRRYCLDGKAFIQLMYNPVSDEEAFTACFGNKLDDVKSPALKSVISDMISKEIDFPVNNNGWVFFSISGDGIRYLHSIGGEQTALNKLLFYFYRNGFKASRMDTYCDILDKENKVVDLIVDNVCSWDTLKLGDTALTTRMRRIDKNFVQHPHVDLNGNHYTNVDIGTHSSNMGMFRCYNKLDEICQGRLSLKDKRSKNDDEFSHQSLSERLLKEYGVEDYFWRLEYELHKDYAAQLFNALMTSAEEDNKLCFEDIFYSVLSKFFGIVDFTSLSRQMADYNYCVIWQEFLDFVRENAIHLVQFEPLSYIPMSKARLYRYMKKNSVFIFSLLTALFLDNNLANAVISDGGNRYFGKKKYNELRDELNVPGWMNLFVKSQVNRVHRSLDKWAS